MKDLKDQYVGNKINKKVKIKIQKMSKNVIPNGKNIYDQPINSDMKRYEEIRKLTTGQDEDYTTGCLLDYI